MDTPTPKRGRPRKHPVTEVTAEPAQMTDNADISMIAAQVDVQAQLNTPTSMQAAFDKAAAAYGAAAAAQQDAPQEAVNHSAAYPSRPDPRDGDVRLGEPRNDGGPRPMDPREEAVRYVEQYDLHNEGVDHDSFDRYRIDVNIIPEGWDYNWKAVRVINQPNHDHLRRVRDGGWRPVLTSRHPNLMPPGTPHEQQIESGGLALFERPLVLSERARQRDVANARQAVKIKEMQAGLAPRDTLDRVKPVIKKEYGHVPIPRV